MGQFRNLIPYVERHLVATSSTVQYQWYTDWMSCDGIDNIRAVIKARNAGGSFNTQMAIQYAAVRADEPLAPAALAPSQAAAGDQSISTGDVSVATNMAANRLFRLGVAYSSSSGVQQADVSITPSWKSVGTSLGQSQHFLEVNDTGALYKPLTGWVPATFMSKIKAVFMVDSITGTTNNFRYQLAYQTAATSVEQPGAWNNAEAGFSTPTGANAERNTGEISVSTTDMWIRLGVAYSLTSGIDLNTTAVLNAICSCR